MGKRHELIETMRRVDAEYLRGKKYTIENCILDRAGISEINGVVDISATVKCHGGGCTLGGHSAGQFIQCDRTIRGSRYGLEALLWLMAVAGVDRSEKLGGQYVRVAFDEHQKAEYIGHIYNDIWLNFDMLAQAIHAEDEAAKAK